MNWWDWVSIGCTFVSLYGAYKTNTDYNKNKQLMIYTNTSVAYVESQKIINILTELAKLSNIQGKRGTSYITKVSEYGTDITKSIDKIRESLQYNEFKEIDNILNPRNIDINKYLNSLISGTVFVGNNFVLDDDFNKCKHAFVDMQLQIKKNLENTSSKIK